MVDNILYVRGIVELRFEEGPESCPEALHVHIMEQWPLEEKPRDLGYRTLGPGDILQLPQELRIELDTKYKLTEDQ